ncbi:MAG TPA: helix-hairpin-helix domain-containing protein [Phycisphaerae bacterium]|nr:helix-hairpin-helix domain-containing protein [Phycisphaerae bacterium]HRW55738.1 helix-hairpin-helix domain-containing protein [Phycisphaerae bacterium]
MIVRIQGRLVELTDDAAIVDREGLAYEVMVPAYARSELAADLGDVISLHTLQYFEGSAAGANLTPRLVGFLRAEDRAFFKLFISVKNMGIRKALKALSTPAGRIAAAIEMGDAAALTKLPGIGKRMAETIVAELKGKARAHALADIIPETAARPEFSTDQKDAIEILVAWGDSRNDAERWIARVAQSNETPSGADEWVTAVYRLKNEGRAVKA